MIVELGDNERKAIISGLLYDVKNYGIAVIKRSDRSEWMYYHDILEAQLEILNKCNILSKAGYAALCFELQTIEHTPRSDKDYYAWLDKMSEQLFNYLSW